MTLPIEVLTGAVRGGTSILYAGLGESVSERTGVVNLGMEGCMLAGALGAYAVTARTGNPWVGVLAGAAAGGALALVHAFFVIVRHANQLATGLVVFFLGLGLTSLFGGPYVSKSIHALKIWRIPLLARIPGLGSILFAHDPLVYLSFIAVPALWWILFRTQAGLILRAAGERAEVLSAAGHRVEVVRAVGVLIGGMLAGVGGAHLSIAYANSWFENMVQGRGFVSLAVVIFAARQPFKVAGGAYLFGAALALSPALQARGYGINQFALDSMPYIVILVVLALLGRKRAADAPESLSRVFEMAPGT